MLLTNSWFLVWFSQSKLLQLANIVKFNYFYTFTVICYKRVVETNYCYLLSELAEFNNERYKISFSDYFNITNHFKALRFPL